MTLALALALAATPQSDAPLVQRFDPAQDVALEQRLGDRLPMDVELRDPDGSLVTLRRLLRGHPAIVALVYYRCPMLCSLVMNGILEAARVLDLRPGEDYELILISIDPTEGPDLASAARARCVERSGIPGARVGFHFLTADRREAVDAVAEAMGFRYVRDRSGQFAHAAGIVVITPEGVLSRYFMGVEYSPRDLGLALVEASGGAVGSFADRVQLLCYAYDPKTGRYGLAILRTIRAVGALTVLALGGFVTRALVLERRRRRE